MERNCACFVNHVFAFAFVIEGELQSTIVRALSVTYFVVCPQPCHAALARVCFTNHFFAFAFVIEGELQSTIVRALSVTYFVVCPQPCHAALARDAIKTTEVPLVRTSPLPDIRVKKHLTNETL